jgi:hypothetical protein
VQKNKKFSTTQVLKKIDKPDNKTGRDRVSNRNNVSACWNDVSKYIGKQLLSRGKSRGSPSKS